MKKPPAVRKPSPERMGLALRDFLDACGLPLDRPDFAQTVERVSKIWINEFLDGYQRDPAQILGLPVTGEADPDVMRQAVTDLTADPGSLVEALDDLGDPAAYSAAGYARLTALAAE